MVRAKMPSATRIVLVAALLVMTLAVGAAACKQQVATSTTQTTQSATNTSTQTTTSNPPTQITTSSTQGPKIVVRATTEVASPVSRAVALEHFKKIVDERLGDRVDLKIYTGGSLYKDAPALDALITGELEMSLNSSFLLMKYDKQITATFAPGMGYETDKKDWFASPSMQATLGGIKAKGITTVAWARSSWGGIATTKRALSPEDVRGVKLRHYDPTAGAVVSTDIWGAPAVFMSFADVPSSLASGAIGGFYTSLDGWVTAKDMAPNFTVVNTTPGETDGVHVFVASTKWWEGLPRDVRDGLAQAAVDAANYEGQINDQVNIDVLQKNGTTDPAKPGAYKLAQAQADLWYKPVYLNLKKLIPVYGESTVKDMAIFQKKTIVRLGIWDQVKADLGIVE